MKAIALLLVMWPLSVLGQGASCRFVLRHFELIEETTLVDVPTGLQPLIQTDRLMIGSQSLMEGAETELLILDRKSLEPLGEITLKLLTLSENEAHLPIYLKEASNLKNWGRGIGSESKFALVAYVFDQHPEIDRIMAVISSDNERSIGLHRKLGFEHKAYGFWYLSRARFAEVRDEFKAGLRSFSRHSDAK